MSQKTRIKYIKKKKKKKHKTKKLEKIAINFALLLILKWW